MKLKSMIFGSSILLLVSCSNELPNEQLSNSDVTGEISFLRDGLDEALNMIAMMENGQTRSHARSIQNISKLNLPSTRSERTVADWYVVNFENDEGFAIITDADYSIKVYGVANEGNFNIADTTFNIGLKYVIQNLENNPDIAKYPDVISVADGGGMPVDSIYYENEPIDDPIGKIVTAPLLTETVRRWHQNAPFNQLSPIRGSRQAPVGCVPLAMMMMMSHYKYPHAYYSPSMNQIYDFDWDIIRNYDYKYIMSRILRELAREYNLDVDWGEYETNTYPYRIPIGFDNFGYLKPSTYYFSNIAENTLKGKYPILMCGFIPGTTKGHCWVVDGLMQMIGAPAIGEPIRTYNFYHCVWGWGGDANAYFRIADTVNTDQGFHFDDFNNPNNYSHIYTFSNYECIGELKKDPAYGQMD